MPPIDLLPDELLEKIVIYLAPPFSTAAPPPQKKNMVSLEKNKRVRRINAARPVLDHDTPNPTQNQPSLQNTARSSTDYGDLCTLSRVSKRFNCLVTPLLYQNITMRVSDVGSIQENFLQAIKGRAGAYVRAVSIRDPDPVMHPKIITPNYRNYMIFAFSNFLVHFFEALCEHSGLVSFHWNVFDTLLIAPMFMDYLPPSIQEFTLDQGRVIPIGTYSNLKKFVYRAHMLSYTSNCMYERRVSRLLQLNFANLRHLRLQNVNLAVCFEFRSAEKFPSLELSRNSDSTTAELDQGAYWPAPALIHLNSTASLPARPLLATHSPELGDMAHADSVFVDSLVHPPSISSPSSPLTTPFSPDSSSSSLSPTPPTATPNPGQAGLAARSSSTSSVYFIPPLTPPSVSQVMFPNLETAYFTDLFTASSVSSFNCEWLIDLLRDHHKNKNLKVKYASRCVGKDAIFAREWGLLVPDPDAVGVNGLRLTDEESFRRAGWGGGRKTGVWKQWKYEYSTIKGWTIENTAQSEL
ncbi:hypothetical protein V1512DRAFT_286010 [Lipomyces arxii]|uniref:uncharacterized protein n=1 Tax=Lipomyces arxii TaxID=56418 RepID=UPI0034CD75F4